MQNLIRDFINVFFPSVCNACKNLLSDNEDFICTDCRHKLPITEFHFNNDKSIDNVVSFVSQVNQSILNTSTFKYLGSFESNYTLESLKSKFPNLALKFKSKF